MAGDWNERMGGLEVHSNWIDAKELSAAKRGDTTGTSGLAAEHDCFVSNKLKKGDATYAVEDRYGHEKIDISYFQNRGLGL